jgi:hypothetical protein
VLVLEFQLPIPFCKLLPQRLDTDLLSIGGARCPFLEQTNLPLCLLQFRITEFKCVLCHLQRSFLSVQLILEAKDLLLGGFLLAALVGQLVVKLLPCRTFSTEFCLNLCSPALAYLAVMSKQLDGAERLGLRCII